MHIDRASTTELQQLLATLEQRHRTCIDQHLDLDLTRGKPSTKQLDLSNALSNILADNYQDSDGTDLRNYGVLDGLPAAKQLFGEILGIDEAARTSRVFIGGNSSLSLMHYTLWFAHQLGLKPGDIAWKQQEQTSGSRTKILCPSPGYDRHFKLCLQLGIEMIPVALTGQGPDMDQVEALVKADPSIKGIWCVPRFSNPSGEVYSQTVVERMARLGTIAGDNFLVLWDNAYAVHSINDRAETLADIDDYASRYDTLDAIIHFGSTSKITYAGAGIGYMASSKENIKGFSKHFGIASIGADKINQMRHVAFLKNLDGVHTLMAKHAKIIAPKFAAVADSLEKNLGNTGMGQWNNPDGGYFVSFNTLPGLAKQVVALAAEANVKLTPAGATFPEGKDPEDSNIRLAPTYPELDDVKRAMEVFVNCVKLASVRQKLAQ